MKTLMKAVAAASLATASVASFADASTSLTIGAVSDYYYRGSNLGDGGAYFSLDYSNSGFYAGTWMIDDGAAGNDGLETDFYFGYAGDVDGFSYSVGYTRYDYTYTNNFEHEINLGVAVAGFSLDVALGNDDDDTTDDDYTVVQLGYSSGAFGATVGQVSYDMADTTDMWAELSYSADIGELSATATLGQRFADESNDDSGFADQYIVLDLSKTFDL